MYLNLYQRCIKVLLDEFGPLYQRQLEALVRRKVNGYFKNLDGYIDQMCRYGDYEKLELVGEALISPAKAAPDGDMLRCMDVMLSFVDSVTAFCVGAPPVKLKFFVRDDETEKEICVIPVHIGGEQPIAAYVDGPDSGETLILLLAVKGQIRSIKTRRPCKFAVIEGQSVIFYTKNQ